MNENAEEMSVVITVVFVICMLGLENRFSSPEESRQDILAILVLRR